MSEVNELTTNNIYLIRYIHEPKEDFQIKEIRVCDCFLDFAICFMRKFVRVSGAREIIDVFVETICQAEFFKNKMFAVISDISIACCNNALYQFDYMEFISKTDMFDKCLCDLPSIRGARNCKFYIDDETEKFDKLCFNCKFNLLNSVSVRFYKITKNVSFVGTVK